VLCEVDKHDVKKLERWLRSWARVRSWRAGRRLLDLAKAFGHKDAVGLLESHEQTNEFVCATFASDLARMKQILALGQGTVQSDTLTNRCSQVVAARWKTWQVYLGRTETGLWKFGDGRPTPSVDVRSSGLLGDSPNDLELVTRVLRDPTWSLDILRRD